MEKQRIKVLLSKPGFDGHWRGILAVSMALRDSGMEVVYGGNQTPQEIAETAVQEDVDVVGLSTLSSGHLRLISEVAQALRQRGMERVLLLVGGTIPKEDIPQLKEWGVSEVFLPGTSLEAIVDYIKEKVRA